MQENHTKIQAIRTCRYYDTNHPNHTHTDPDQEGIRTELPSGDLMADIKTYIRQEFPFDKPNKGQFEAIFAAIVGFVVKGKRHVVLEAPTGVGKSVIAVTVHRVINRLFQATEIVDGNTQFRSTIITTTRGLQDQYAADGWIDEDLRSKTNYPCAHDPASYYGDASCRKICHDKRCSPGHDCTYLIKKKKWLEQAIIRTTNNAMHITMPHEMVGTFHSRADMMVIDECHKLDQSLLNATQMKFAPKMVHPLIQAKTRGAEEVQSLLEDVVLYFEDKEKGHIYKISERFLQLTGKLAEEAGGIAIRLDNAAKAMQQSPNVSYADLERIQTLQATISSIVSFAEILGGTDVEAVIVYEQDDSQVILKPIFPSDVAEYSLFSKCDVFLHMSATICGMGAHAARLGIEPSEVFFYNVTNPIPEENRLINYIPVEKMSGRASMEKAAKIAKVVDDLIDNMYPTDNGLIHTVSYDLARMIKECSRHKKKMFVGGGKERQQILKGLKESKDGLVVLSPAMEEGYDLKDDLCRFCVIAKVPYEFMGDPLVKYVSSQEPDQYFRQAILRIVQASGRGVRGVNDYADTYVLDSSFGSLVSRNEKFFPTWFTEAVRVHKYS